MVKLAPAELDCDHEAELSGAWPVFSNGAPSIVARTDEDFISGLLEELAGENPSSITTTHRPSTGTDSVLRLYQPVHRTFNLALLEAHCDNFGQPRLDPRKIASAGLVVRRVATSSNGAKNYEAWCATKSRVAGWVALPDASGSDHLRDPDPARRPQPRLTGDPVFDRQQFGSGDLTAEEHTSLFVAPAAVAATTKRTLLYGVIPVTSSSRAGSLPRGAEDNAWQTAWAQHLSPLLQESSYPITLWTSSTQRLSTEDIKNTPNLNLDGSVNTYAARFVLLVRQLAQEFSFNRPKNPETHRQLVAKLDTISITLVDNTTVTAGSYLAQASRLYFELPPPSLSLPCPKIWPAISSTLASEIRTLLRQTAGEIELASFSTFGSAGRFDDLTARYVIRAFIRVKQPRNCPPKIVWSPYSEEFRIVPWYESSPVAPVPVALPDPFDPNFLKNAKSNVAFTVPKSLAGFLNQDPKKLIKGEGNKGPAMALDWICGFSIPIITICAFILLNIILGLLNIIFFWLPFVKICIPFPRPAQPPTPPSSP